MAEQETLVERAQFNPDDHGLWRRFVDESDRTIVESAWLRACAEKGFVGTCRQCGDYMLPSPPEQVGNRKDFEAHCRSRITAPGLGCGAILIAPGGRVPRSALKSDRKRKR